MNKKCTFCDNGAIEITQGQYPRDVCSTCAQAWKDGRRCGYAASEEDCKKTIASMTTKQGV